MTYETATHSNGELRIPVSVKAVIFRDGAVLLRKNPRDEWELPGGKLELGETPEQCVVREVAEEVGWNTDIETLIDAWVYTIFEGRHVLILTYGCRPVAPQLEDPVSPEGCELAFFPAGQVTTLNMPDGYKRSIKAWETMAGAVGLAGTGPVETV